MIAPILDVNHNEVNHHEDAESFSSSRPLTILVPVFNDWAAAGVLLAQLDDVFAEQGLRAQVIFINDGSTEAAPAGFPNPAPKYLDKVVVLELRRNLGH